MSSTRRLTAVLAAVAGLFTTIGIVSEEEVGATAAVNVQQPNPTITITNEGVYYSFSPTQLDARVGEPITVTNNDPRGVHSITEKDRLFSVDVPPNSSKTLTVSEAGNYQYFCDWHAANHEPKYGSLNIS